MKKFSKFLLGLGITGAVMSTAFLFGFNTFAEEVNEMQTITSAVDWLKSWNASDLQACFGWLIGYLGANFLVILGLVIKICMDVSNKAKMRVEAKENQTNADKKVIELLTQVNDSLKKAQDDNLKSFEEFAKKYDIKITEEATSSVKSTVGLIDNLLNDLNSNKSE